MLQLDDNKEFLSSKTDLLGMLNLRVVILAPTLQTPITPKTFYSISNHLVHKTRIAKTFRLERVSSRIAFVGFPSLGVSATSGCLWSCYAYV